MDFSSWMAKQRASLSSVTNGVRIMNRPVSRHRFFVPSSNHVFEDFWTENNEGYTLLISRNCYHVSALHQGLTKEGALYGANGLAGPSVSLIITT